MSSPRGCTHGVYVPWVCGKCERKAQCKPRNVSNTAKYERKAKVKT